MTLDFKNLTVPDYDLLMKFPAYISLLAANTDGSMDVEEQQEAIAFTHMKTYTSDAVLADFYNEVDANFKATLRILISILPKGKAQRDDFVKEQLSLIEAIVLKLDPDNVKIIHHSMQTYKEHVSQAHHTILSDFLLPIDIAKISKKA